MFLVKPLLLLLRIWCHIFLKRWYINLYGFDWCYLAPVAIAYEWASLHQNYLLFTMRIIELSRISILEYYAHNSQPLSRQHCWWCSKSFNGNSLSWASQFYFYLKNIKKYLVGTITRIYFICTLRKVKTIYFFS